MQPAEKHRIARIGWLRAADLAREDAELNRDPDGEHRELAAIYVGRGLNPSLAKLVTNQLMARDGANVWIGALRITPWGALAMAITAGVGALFGSTV